MSRMPTQAGTSVLASLTAQVLSTTVMQEKQAAAKLTPVAGEVAGPTFPSDLPGAYMSKEQMHDIALDLREKAAALSNIADGLDTLSGIAPVEKPVDLDALRKEKERAADVAAKARANDNAFEAAFADKAAAAQAATFTPPPASEPGLWLCPEHERGIEKTSNNTGRKYRGCPDCNRFERV